MKILIIHTAFIGDIVLSTPLIKKVKDIYPDSEMDYLTLPSNKIILENNPHLREVMTYDKRGKDSGIRGFLNILKKVAGKKYDLALIPHRFIRSIALARFAGIKKVVGFDVATGSFLLTEKKHYDMNKHEVERLLNLLDYEGEKVPVEIYPGAGEKKRIDELLEDKKFKKLIVVAPGSQRPEKIWPVKKYGELIGRLSENPDNFICITGGKAEKSMPLGIGESENIMDLRGEISLLEFAELLSRADIVVSNDSSPVHIGSGFDKPFIIGIFGPGKRCLGFFPWSDRSVVIEDNIFYENNMENIPERQHEYRKDYYKEIPSITVDRVYEEVVKRL